MYQYWFMNYNKCNMVTKDVNKGDEPWGIQELSIESSKQFYKSKTIPRWKGYLKKINKKLSFEFAVCLQKWDQP